MMIATLTLDTTAVFAAAGWAGVGATLIGLGAIVARAFVERPRRAPRPAAVPEIEARDLDAAPQGLAA